MILKFRVQSFNIMPFGFLISFRVDTKNYNKKVLKANLLAIKKIIISFAGPFVNLIFILLFLLLKRKEVFGIETDTLVYANFLIFIFNIMPIYPLDGGRILKNILYLFLGRIESLKITNVISNIITYILTIITILVSVISSNISYIFVIIYIWIILLKENKICNMKLKMYKILKNDIAINKD